MLIDDDDLALDRMDDNPPEIDADEEALDAQDDELASTWTDTED
ncbi:hypothetical protein ACUB14_001589 [Pseudomonas aeruginosa]|jgi:hypothetical protein|nr:MULTISPECIES: hypothetical protein [Pseudomonas]MDS1044333.1 hypothetical protein [Pseudomonas aeruginosa]